jgi:hypothetical protein
LAVFEHALDDFVSVKGLFCILEYFGNDVSNSSLTIAPFAECVDATADEYEALVLDKFVVDSLGGNVFALKRRTTD